MVSVVMPIYNCERFVGEAIATVLAQELQDWELIAVDDGSTDATPQILAGFCDPRIRVIRQKNGGEASARNTALDAAMGEFIAFLDADDLLFPNTLAEMAGFLESHDEFDVVYSDGVICDQNRNALLRLSEIRAYSPTGSILEDLVVNNVVTVPACVVIRRSAIETHGLRFDPSLRYGVDWDFWTQLARHSQFGYLPVLTCMYRVHGANMTSSVHARQRKSELVTGRMKILNVSWFSDLSLSTRRRFFGNLLVQLLDQDVTQQAAIIRTTQFEALPTHARSELLRQVAACHLSHKQNTEYAIQCLRMAVDLQSSGYKSRLLYQLASHSPTLAASALRAWRVLHDTSSRMRTIGRPVPKPVPAALLPITD